MQCTKTDNTLYFMHQIKRGIAQRSFGLEVAKLARIPEPIIKRAGLLLHDMENSNRKTNDNQPGKDYSPFHNEIEQLKEKNAILAQKLLQQTNLLNALHSIDMNTLSPKQAFDLVWELMQTLKS